MFYISAHNEVDGYVEVTDTSDWVAEVTTVATLNKHCFCTGDKVYGFTVNPVTYYGRVRKVLKLNQDFDKLRLRNIIRHGDGVEIENYLAELKIGTKFMMRTSINDEDYTRWFHEKVDYDKWKVRVNNKVGFELMTHDRVAYGIKHVSKDKRIFLENVV